MMTSRFVWMIAGSIAASLASPALAATGVCPMTSAELGQQLDKLTKTSDVDNMGLVLRSYSGAGLKILGASPVQITSNWVEGAPVAVEFTLANDSSKYIDAFRKALGGSAVNCAQGQCAWRASAAAPSGLRSATLDNEVVIHRAVVRCEYE